MQLPFRMAAMKAITIKLSDATLRRLRQEARETGRSVASLVRDRLETSSDPAGESVHALASDLAGCLEGSRRAATNERRRFRRS
jgi:predicted transcriptional regulator